MNTPASLRALLENLIDYAGLFPPASLDMKHAVRNYAEYIHGEDSWMLRSFIAPMTKLDDFQDEFDSLETSGAMWRISALSSADNFNEDLQRVLTFNRNNDSRARVDAFEIKIVSADEIESVMRATHNQHRESSFDVFFELALNDDLSTLIKAIHNAHAKIRTGGITASQIPSSSRVLNFIRTAHQHHASFKATAGLHHPLRAERNLTYGKEAPRAVMHGFLNVFLTAAFILDGMDDREALRILDETDASAFKFEDEFATWRDAKISTEKLKLARQNFALSFGSCSFIEPIEDLRALELL
ncbi:MAG: hypothetical protein MSG64_02295 [Pyrinomonadaceae bacterium MAG19_C2-C3]|nr:hypothetical protein [Pyrinomonadaceae bacterium MAG19_C2-C3]